MSEYLKLKYNISTWPQLKLNYWGIPKCGNTSIKYALLEKSNQASKEDIKDNVNAWVHSKPIYIMPEDANNNGFENFTVIRNPYDRVISLYNDFGLSLRHLLVPNANRSRVSNLDYFLETHIKNSTDDDNIHLRSMCYFLYEFSSNDGKIFDIENINFAETKYDIKIPKLNKTNNELTLTNNQKYIIKNRYWDDFRLFEYITW